MNTIKTFYNKIHIAFFMVIFSAGFNFAQTVTVPSNCNVITTDTSLGGVLGAGGKVTNNGVVSMPDTTLTSPFTSNQGGEFFFNPPAGIVTTASWSLKGDLSNVPTLGTIPGVTGVYNGAIQSITGTLVAKIYSYNKSYRPNSTETSNPSYGRSKGQIKVNWFGAGCSNSITFDVYKNFVNALPAIVGPTCLKPNTQYTYSVDRIVSDNTNDNIGFDSYYWTGLPGSILTSNGFYTSADNSSITFTTGSSVLPIPNLQCCYGRVNPNTGDGGLSSVTTTPVVGAHTTCVSAPIIIVAPSPPTYTTGFAPPTCVPTGTVASPAIFTIQYPNIASGLTYTWTAANTGWIDPVTNLTFTPVVNTTSGFTNLTINTAGNNNPGELTLTITGPCDPAIYKYQINRNITAPLTIVPTGNTTTCLAGTSSGNTFTISPTNSNGVTWYLTAINSSIQINPLGVTLLNSDTSTVTINFACFTESFT